MEPIIPPLPAGYKYQWWTQESAAFTNMRVMKVRVTPDSDVYFSGVEYQSMYHIHTETPEINLEVLYETIDLELGGK